MRLRFMWLQYTADVEFPRFLSCAEGSHIVLFCLLEWNVGSNINRF